MNRNEFRALNAAGRLPTPKGVALRVLRLIQSETVSAQEIAAAIKADPALVGRIIGAANASYHRAHRPVASVLEALARVGTAATCRLALGLSLVSQHQAGRCGGFDYPAYWGRSLVMALTMQGLARRTQMASPEEVFSVGLLAGIGELALATLHAESYGDVLAQAADADSIEALIAVERAAYATDRVELGQHLLADWGFPDVFLESIALAHHDPAGDPAPDSRRYALTKGLRIAERIAQCAIGPKPTRDTMADILALASTLDLAAGELMATWDEIAAAWPTWTKLLELDLPKLAPLKLKPVAAPPVAPGASERAAAAGAASTTPPVATRVLVVTSDAEVRSAIATILSPAGLNLTFADSDQTALHATVTGRPQLVIYEWHASSVYGLGLCRTLRESAIGRGAYILVLSDRPGEGALVEALESGADDFLPWPSAPEVVAARIRVGRRILSLQEDLARDRDEIRRYATEQAVANRRLREVARSDPLTGLPNRRHAMDKVETEWRAAEKTGRPLSCLMIDIDNFKQINDSFWHAVGDEVLTRIAEILRDNARALDTVCRVGGEEFLVVCRDTDRAAAMVCGERLRAVVQAAEIKLASRQHAVTVSVGVAAV